MYASRRDFIKFLTGGALGTMAVSIPGLVSCQKKSANSLSKTSPMSFTPVLPSSEDQFLLARELQFDFIIKWGDPLNAQGDLFGFNNDYNALLPIPGKPDELLMWTNHEYHSPLFVGRHSETQIPTLEQVKTERKSVGGSFYHLKKDPQTGRWKFDFSGEFNQRFDADSVFAIAWPQPMAGQKTAIGTLGNCAGGVTPWNTILTCEEGFEQYYGNVDFLSQKKLPPEYHWEKYFDYPHEHYGWVVEINPWTRSGKKLIALGRFAHESATVTKAKDGRIVVYSGDDRNDQCFYKFISDSADSLERGTLYVASIEKGQWLPLTIEGSRAHPQLQATFKSQTDLLIHTRLAADLVGGTKLDRPEDIDIHPLTGEVFLTLTNNIPKGNFHGSIMKFIESDPGDLNFKHEVFLAGGKENKFSCPDNMVFDSAGNLWMATDISGTNINKNEQIPFKNNGLFYIPTSGPQAGLPLQVASAPIEAEITGLCFSPDEKTLFVSIQHPGEKSTSLEALTSRWPNFGQDIPRPAVVAIYGQALENMTKKA
jgi:secreted PhoX family phosphatase